VASVPDLALAAPPRRVFLFSGHRIDVPERRPARFAAGQADAAAAAIGAALDGLDGGPGDLGLTQGSSGGDILFAEACLDRGIALRLLQPGAEGRFVDESVRASADGERWVERYGAIRARMALAPLALPAEGLARRRFERANEWLLETALHWGAERCRFICLWDGQPSGGSGGTAHLVELVRERGLAVTWLDARNL
jgi:hypothetical protein